MWIIIRGHEAIIQIFLDYMPIREDVFQNNCYYHIFDKTIENKNVFSTEKIANEFIQTFLYYRSINSSIKFSKFKTLKQKEHEKIQSEIMNRDTFKIDIVSYNLMPDHYHFIIKQVRERGIITFMANILNSITRYYNILNDRKGPIFLTQFRSKKIYTEEQLVYISRYIHTNPYADGVIDEIDDIFNYPYSSIKSYIGYKNIEKINTQDVLSYFENDINRYKNFILRNADDQKEHKYLQHIGKWR